MREDSASESNSQSAFKITEQDLNEVFFHRVDGETRSSSIRIEPIVSEGDTVLFLVHFKNGWKLLSSDKRTSPILAYGADEELDSLLLAKNPALQSWLDVQCAHIRALRETQSGEKNPFWAAFDRVPETRDEIDPPGPGWRLIHTGDTIIVYHDVPHLIETKWSQDSLWYHCFPFVGNDYPGIHCHPGCMNVAFAQIAYWAHSEYGVPVYMYTDAYCNDYMNPEQQYTFFFNDSSATDWSSIKKTASSPGSADYASYLMVKVSQMNDTHYWMEGSNQITGSNSNITTINAICEYFGLSCNYSNYNENTVLASLITHKPVYIFAYINTPFGGHGWIIDGYHRHYHCIKRYYIWDPNHTYVIPGEENIGEEDEPGGEIFSGMGFSFDFPEGYNTYTEEWPSQYEYLLMNWGFGGYGDNFAYNVNTIGWAPNGAGSPYLNTSAHIATGFAPIVPTE